MVPFSFVSACRSYWGAVGGCLFCATSDKAQKKHARRRILRKPSDAMGVIRSRMAPPFQGATGRLGAVENQHRNYRLAVSSCAKNEASFLAPNSNPLFNTRDEQFRGGMGRSGDLRLIPWRRRLVLRPHDCVIECPPGFLAGKIPLDHDLIAIRATVPSSRFPPQRGAISDPAATQALPGVQADGD